MSNAGEVLADVTETDNLQVCRFGEHESYKTLGVGWNSTKDTITYRIKNIDKRTELTKCNILSHIASIFDPLGVLSPITIIAKMLMQSIWEHKLKWDDNLPLHLQNSWSKFQSELCCLN